MKEVLKINPWKGIGLILSIYFLPAIPLFPISGEYISTRFDGPGLNDKLLMPLAYVVAPIIFIIRKLMKS